MDSQFWFRLLNLQRNGRCRWEFEFMNFLNDLMIERNDAYAEPLRNSLWCLPAQVSYIRNIRPPREILSVPQRLMLRLIPFSLCILQEISVVAGQLNCLTSMPRSAST